MLSRTVVTQMHYKRLLVCTVGRIGFYFVGGWLVATCVAQSDFSFGHAVTSTPCRWLRP
jgi:hypothetical protein